MKKALRDDANTTRCAGCIKADPQTNKQTNRSDYNTLRSSFASAQCNK